MVKITSPEGYEITIQEIGPFQTKNNYFYVLILCWILFGVFATIAQSTLLLLVCLALSPVMLAITIIPPKILTNQNKFYKLSADETFVLVPKTNFEKDGGNLKKGINLLIKKCNEMKQSDADILDLLKIKK